MAKVNFKRGTKAQLPSTPLQDGLISFTTDDGKIHIDYTDVDNQVKRKTLYSGKLTIGKYVYDGSNDVQVDVYDGGLE